MGAFAVASPGLAIAGPVLNGDAQGGFYLFALPLYTSVAVVAGIVVYHGVQAVGRFVQRSFGSAYHNLRTSFVALGVIASLAWSALVWPSAALVLVPCEHDPPVWSQTVASGVPTDGEWIVYASFSSPPSWGEALKTRLEAGFVGSDIYVMQGDGQSVARLTTDSCHYSIPRFSPDGTRIAFQAERSEGQRTLIMNSDGASVEDLTEVRQRYVAELEWAPDGRGLYHDSEKAIKFVGIDSDARDRPVYRYKEESICACFQVLGSNRIAVIVGAAILVVDVSTGDVRELVQLDPKDVDDEVTVTNPRVSDFAISSDERQVALVKEREVPIREGYAYATEIFVQNVDGSSLRRLTPSGRDESDPSWSRDGKQLLLSSTALSTADADIYVVTVDGKNRRRLTNGGHNFSPDWTH